ncbi:dTDP-4-dehydrorhamnose reductase [Phycicoccus badiiscoriae]|uniref:dTDP-4-dehydrorhamnose reductase n=1 Tax=Pedococcus badiiscoriae TaxID=642776 RepID=A0A852WA12_9MICO|nr:dTDP-4-dehydrorhamnose reductase [Pedococcus badiiscoriae]NYG06067.1 dTDP-4-dehydrorhamnose reductase [Pedococcus badiiscoriae]
MTRWLVTGAGGMLGLDMQVALALAGVSDDDVTGLTRSDLDVTDPEATRDAIRGHDVVVNCAAYTRVDDAESHEGQAFSVNALGAANVADACRTVGARLVHVSTDYVFAGEATEPYAEDAPVAPLSAYGRTKAAGEWAVQARCPQAWIVRTAWLYGAGGPNFVKTMARLADTRETVDVVDDQTGQPTWTMDVAGAIMRLVDDAAPFGVWHATSQGETTKYGLAREIFRGLGLDPERVRPTTSDAFPLPAPRPSYSVLGHDAWRMARIPRLPHWQESLATSLHDVVERLESS